MSERDKYIREAQLKFGINREEAKKRLMKIGILDSKGQLAGDAKSRTVSDIVQSECASIVEKSVHFKEGFRSAMISAMNNVLKNNQDALFYHGANLISKTSSTGADVSKSQRLTNLVQWVYGDTKGNVSKTAIRDAGKFKHVIFLTLVTVNKLITGKNTQQTTFEQLVKNAKLDKTTSVSLASFKAKTECKRVTTRGKLLSKSEVDCTPEQWASIYLVLSEVDLIKIVSKLI